MIEYEPLEEEAEEVLGIRRCVVCGEREDVWDITDCADGPTHVAPA